MRRPDEALAALKGLPNTWVGARALSGFADRPAERTLPCHFGDLDEILPGGGLPRGAVVEIATPSGLAAATSIALAACASAQAEAKLRGGDQTAGAWCAWIEVGPEDHAASTGARHGATGSEAAQAPTLYAPAVERRGVDLARLLVALPPPSAVARVAVRMAASRVFAVLVVDLAGVPGAQPGSGVPLGAQPGSGFSGQPGSGVPRPGLVNLDRWVTPVRRLAITVEPTETTVMILTDMRAKRSQPLPTALRLEVDRASTDRLAVTVAKERYGRVAPPQVVFLPWARATIVARRAISSAAPERAYPRRSIS